MRVKVYNDNTHPLSEEFKGETIVIAPGEFIEMDRGEATLFKGQFKTPKFLASGVQDPATFKQIRIVPLDDGVPDAPKRAVESYVCQACGFEAKNKAGLTAHIRHNHAEQMLDEDAKKDMLENAS